MCLCSVEMYSTTIYSDLAVSVVYIYTTKKTQTDSGNLKTLHVTPYKLVFCDIFLKKCFVIAAEMGSHTLRFVPVLMFYP